MGDFIRFLAELQLDYYERRQQRLRELGYKAVTVTTAWKAGGPAASAGNLWTDDAMDAIDRHNYFGGGAGGHNITTGSVSNDTHMNKAGRGILSSGFWQVEDRPFIMTEWTQKPPNQWKAEISPLLAFYGMGLQGWDAILPLRRFPCVYGQRLARDEVLCYLHSALHRPVPGFGLRHL